MAAEAVEHPQREGRYGIALVVVVVVEEEAAVAVVVVDMVLGQDGFHSCG